GLYGNGAGSPKPALLTRMSTGRTRSASRSAASLHRAGAVEAGAAQALGEAARARMVPAARTAADALDRAARGAGGNVEMVRPAWLTAQAEHLRDHA
ncbi:hypothetical protein ACWDA9_42425, partial [Streptomyces sp. NPDC001193]